mmetsp:Transcript_68236/g.199656  ORF Transcript_68236/g.199656 Transcript_68236/m.199656 type:complete len:250 (-) Transcript_68236:946-1695(-)
MLQLLPGKVRFSVCLLPVLVVGGKPVQEPPRLPQRRALGQPGVGRRQRHQCAALPGQAAAAKDGAVGGTGVEALQGEGHDLVLGVQRICLLSCLEEQLPQRLRVWRPVLRRPAVLELELAEAAVDGLQRQGRLPQLRPLAQLRLPGQRRKAAAGGPHGVWLRPVRSGAPRRRGDRLRLPLRLRDQPLQPLVDPPQGLGALGVGVRVRPGPQGQQGLSLLLFLVYGDQSNRVRAVPVCLLDGSQSQRLGR